ncbi:MAG: hypothetical protein H8D67_05410 [Deltaproteobacteria bacterium]|nr:hypothetical protein [Deltaproteobacteria bacterium]
MNSKCRFAILALSISLVIIFGAYAAGDWVSEDIGTQGGDTKYDEASGKWTIDADGADIWGNSDGFRMVYQEVSGDFEISCQVLSIENTNSWAKGGVMARNSNTAPASYAFSFVTVGNGTSLQWRLTDGDRGWPDGGGITGTAPYYVKLVREGDMFYGLRSQDGESWEENHTVGMASEIEVVMDDPIVAGIALTSHSAGVICTAEFDSLEASFLDFPVKPQGKLATTWAEIKK